MGSLNPRWLSIELESIDATVENWSAAVRTSYEAALQTLVKREVPQEHFYAFYKELLSNTGDVRDQAAAA
jgi:hypothetical protein